MEFPHFSGSLALRQQAQGHDTMRYYRHPALHALQALHQQAVLWTLKPQTGYTMDTIPWTCPW